MAIRNPAMLTRASQSSNHLRDRQLIEGVVGKLPAFAAVAPRYVAEVASHARTMAVRRGAAICRRGESLPGIIAIGHGRVTLSVPRANGVPRIVRFVQAGDTFGEASALFGRPSAVDSAALTESFLVIIPATPVLRLMERDPQFSHRMVGVLAERVRLLAEELQASVRLKGSQRLAAYLHALVRKDCGQGGLTLPTSKTVIAARLGIAKATLSRLLRRLAEENLIAIRRSEVEVLDVERLAQVAGKTEIPSR
jgi:CRP/FNR family transcriptional regulator, dissimilatory nitrate respiration regulator